MSAGGLVHVVPKQPSEFIPLSEWMRQSTLFSMLRSIRFYKLYLHTKCFNLWRCNVRYKLYCQQRKRLSHSLFIAKESFCTPLLELRERMLELGSVRLLDLGESRQLKVFECSQFIEHQAIKRQDAAKRFETSMERVAGIVQKVCTDVTNLARTADAQGGVLLPSADGAAVPFDMDIGGAGDNKNKSMVSIKKEESDRRRMLRRAEQEAGMLADFIRLADYMAIESLVELTVRTNRDFLAELLKDRKAGLFETTVQFTDEGTVFSPMCSMIQGMIHTMTDAMITTMSNVTRILYLRPFAEHIANVVRDAPSVPEIVRSLSSFRHICDSISDKVEVDFGKATEYVTTFQSVRPIYEYNRKWNLEAYRRQSHSVPSLKEEMELVANWEKELEKMRARQPCGILEVESRKLKQTLIPLTGEKMDALKGLVKELSRAKCKEQLVKYKSRISKISQRPQHLKDFAAQVDAVEELKTKDKSLFKHTQMVEQMYQLLGHYDVKISSDDLVQLDELRSYQQQYLDEMDEAQAYKDERMPEMTQQLDMNIARLNDNIAQISASIDEGIFVDVSYFDNPEPVLAALEQVKAKLEVTQGLANTYSANQALFNILAYNYKNLKKANESYERMNSLWTMISRWNDQEEAWFSDPLPDMDVEEMSREVQLYSKEGYSLHKKMGNDVTNRLKEKTNEVKAKMPIVLELGNPSMQPRHWKKIYDALGQPFYEGTAFSLENLIGYGILNHAELVGEVSAAASGEAQLEASLEQIAAGWETTEFTVLNHRDQVRAIAACCQYCCCCCCCCCYPRPTHTLPRPLSP